MYYTPRGNTTSNGYEPKNKKELLDVPIRDRPKINKEQIEVLPPFEYAKRSLFRESFRDVINEISGQWLLTSEKHPNPRNNPEAISSRRAGSRTQRDSAYCTPRRANRRPMLPSGGRHSAGYSMPWNHVSPATPMVQGRVFQAPHRQSFASQQYSISGSAFEHPNSGSAFGHPNRGSAFGHPNSGPAFEQPSPGSAFGHPIHGYPFHGSAPGYSDPNPAHGYTQARQAYSHHIPPGSGSVASAIEQPGFSPAVTVPWGGIPQSIGGPPEQAYPSNQSDDAVSLASGLSSEHSFSSNGSDSSFGSAASSILDVLNKNDLNEDERIALAMHILSEHERNRQQRSSAMNVEDRPQERDTPSPRAQDRRRFEPEDAQSVQSLHSQSQQQQPSASEQHLLRQMERMQLMFQQEMQRQHQQHLNFRSELNLKQEHAHARADALEQALALANEKANTGGEHSKGGAEDWLVDEALHEDFNQPFLFWRTDFGRWEDAWENSIRLRVFRHMKQQLPQDFWKDVETGDVRELYTRVIKLNSEVAAAQVSEKTVSLLTCMKGDRYMKEWLDDIDKQVDALYQLRQPVQESSIRALFISSLKDDARYARVIDKITRKPDMPMTEVRARLEAAATRAGNLCRPDDPSAQQDTKIARKAATLADKADKRAAHPETPNKATGSNQIPQEVIARLRHQPCPVYFSTGACPWGDDCHRSHNADSVRNGLKADAKPTKAGAVQNAQAEEKSQPQSDLKATSDSAPEPDEGGPTVCYSWVQNFDCSYGDKCKFLHARISKPP